MALRAFALATRRFGVLDAIGMAARTYRALGTAVANIAVVAVVAVGAVGAAGCGDDPSLRVRVQHPDDTRIADLITETTITIYEGALTCSEVELGDVHGAELDAFAVTSVTITDDSSRGSFSGVSRLEHKVIVARGYDVDAALVTAGCAEHDEIVDGSEVTITTIVAATVSVGNAEDGRRGVIVTATDPLSKPIDRRPVSWRLFGPAGTSADPARFTNIADGIWEPKTPSCTRNGGAIVHPAPPNVPAGYAVRARVSWAAERPPLFTLFTKLDVLTTSALSPTALQPCAVRRTTAAKSIVCLETPTTVAEYKLSGSTLSRTALPPIEAAVAVVSIVENDQRHVYGITDEGKWIAIADAPAARPNQAWCPDALCNTLDVQIVPACGTSPSVILAQVGTVATSTFVTMPVRGGPVSMYRTRGSAILNAGCLTELAADGSATSRQAVAIETEPLTPGGPTAVRVLFDCSASAQGCANLLVGEGVGFTGGDEPRMIVSDFDATGAVLSTVVARPNDSGGASFIERARQPAAAPPIQIVPAQLDTDGETDLLWHFTTGRFGNIQVSYAREVEGSPLTALFPTGSEVVDLLASDLNGDNFDEAMFVIDTQTSGRRLAIIPMGRPYTAEATPSDAPCP